MASLQPQTRWNRKVPAKPLRVDAEKNPWDKTVLKYAAGGMATKFIIEKAKEVGGKELTPSQITYRLRHFGLTQAAGASRMDYRNGRSPFCELMFKAMDQPSFERELFKHLRAHEAI